MDRKARWEKIHAIRQSGEGGAGRDPTPSLLLIGHAQVGLDAPILDVGGGVSHVVDALVDAGYTDVTLIDVAPTALADARARLGVSASAIRFIEGDVITEDLPVSYAIWHDRAVFHFLIDEDERRSYIDNLRRHLRPGGHLIIGCFAPEAPDKCCGMAIKRYSPHQLAEVLPAEFTIQEVIRTTHHSPAGKKQPFVYTRFQFKP